MSSDRRLQHDQPKSQQGKLDQWVPMRTFLNANGDEMVAIRDDQDQLWIHLLAELFLMTWGSPRPAGHVCRFKDGNRQNRALANLEWAPVVSTGSGKVT